MVSEREDLLGERLVAAGLISAQDLEAALDMQKKSGDRLGRILLSEGRINTMKLYRELADQQELPFVDLVKNPCNLSLLDKGERQKYFDLEALPWKKEKGRVHIATATISRELIAWAKEKYGQKYEFAMTSPYDIYWSLREHFAEFDDDIARNLLWREDPQRSAKNLFSGAGKFTFAAILSLIFLVFFFFEESMLLFFITINIFYVLTLLFKASIFALGTIEEYRDGRKVENSCRELADDALPVYTLLIPLFREKEITIATLISSIRRLDYPRSKLDVKLIVEEGDSDTIEIIKALKCERIFEIIRVPYSLPQTKPKACNYALRFARGKYVTIYDAEDMPDPAQLRKVVKKFMEADPLMVCVQARLNYYNRDENLLTRMFAIEYSSWFDFMLRGLEILKIPIPLGGTSNHFHINVLRDLYAWDPYNVTEDADLGIRLALHGYRASILDSTTMEEAPITLPNWFKQRTRWIKGYIQTWLVHMKDPLKLVTLLGWRGMFGFAFFVGAPSIAFLTIPFVLMISAGFWLSQNEVLPSWLLQLCIVNFFANVVIHVGIAMTVLVRRKWMHMLSAGLLFPFYWILHILASFRALWQLIACPYYWEKTDHGVSGFLSTLSDIQKSHSLLDKQKEFM